MRDGELTVSDAALLDVIRYYTREAGVRSLERELARICRKVVKELSLVASKAKLGKSGKSTMRKAQVQVTGKNLDKYLGVRKHRYGLAEEQNEVGLVTGLAWTEVGGELLSIEVSVVPGKGKLLQTGSLGDVMQESIHAALSVVRSRADMLGIDPEFHQKLDLHVHVPEGANAQGWAQRGDCHVHGPRIGFDPHTSACRCCDDRRNHPARARTADWRTQGKAVGSTSRRNQDCAHPRGQ